MSLSSPNVGSVDPSVDDSMLIRRVQQGLSAFELVYRPHPNWPCSPLMNNNTHNSHLSLAILDSSFNPPTRAHFALAVAPPPAPDSSRYDARLLLLSVRNADKHLKSSDATYEQRLRMMRLLAADMFDADELANAAVAVIDAPTFVAKASILQTAITSYLTDKASRPKLTFIQGMDTLERFLAARYYGSDNAMHDALAKFFSLDGDNAAIVCARRTMTSGGDVAPEDEAERLLLEAAKEYVAAGRLSIMGIGDALQSMSSSEVRAKLASGDSSWKDCVTQRISTYIEQEGLYRN